MAASEKADMFQEDELTHKVWLYYVLILVNLS